MIHAVRAPAAAASRANKRSTAATLLPLLRVCVVKINRGGYRAKQRAADRAGGGKGDRSSPANPMRGNRREPIATARAIFHYHYGMFRPKADAARET